MTLSVRRLVGPLVTSRASIGELFIPTLNYYNFPGCMGHFHEDFEATGACMYNLSTTLLLCVDHCCTLCKESQKRFNCTSRVGTFFIIISYRIH